jgi:uncharacterized protein YndB with AHSA1/START domain
MKEKLHAEIVISAPREKVWDTMLGEGTYTEWTAPFNPAGGSYFKGSWEEGADIRFIGPDPETGKEGGMISRIKESRKPEFLSIEHLGIMKDGVDDFSSEEVKKWTPAFENYTFASEGEGTKVSIDQDIESEYKEMFEGMWEAALAKLKEVCER